jgi:hypothetical protein
MFSCQTMWPGQLTEAIEKRDLDVIIFACNRKTAAFYVIFVQPLINNSWLISTS